MSPGRLITGCLFALAAGWPAPLPAAPTLDLQLVTAGVTNPVYVASAGDGSGRLFIVEQAGRVRIFDGATLLAPPFLDISSQVNPAGEQGLLSVAFHPGYATNGHFYVYFTNANGSSNVVARFTASPPSANTVATNTVLTVLRIAHLDAGNHNGGQLQFGPDGFLYIAPGDGGGSCDNTGPGNNAQNLGSWLGKLLRVDVNNFSTNYTIPPSNPFIATNGALPEIWAYGLRNPWRFSFDRLTGDLFIGDVGQGTREEVDFQAASSAGAQNYGWRLYEGSLASITASCTSITFSNVPAVFPIIEYSRSPSRAVTGGYRYRGNAITPLVGTYIYCDYFNPAPITGATPNGGGIWQTNLLLTANFNVSSFGEDADGELYVCRHSTSAGAIYRIVWRDTDGDGMADDWENDHSLNPNSNGDAGLDPDGDGYTNLEEFTADTDPHVQSSALRITEVEHTGLTVAFSFTTSSNKLYRVDHRDDLTIGDWGTLTNTVAGTGGVVTVSDPSPSPANRFYRVRVAP